MNETEKMKLDGRIEQVWSRITNNEKGEVYYVDIDMEGRIECAKQGTGRVRLMDFNSPLFMGVYNAQVSFNDFRDDVYYMRSRLEGMKLL